MATTKVPAEFLADNTISGTIIADNAVTAVHIATNAISGTLIADNAVTTVHIAENNVTSTSIVQNAVTATQIATNAINTLQIADVQVTSAKIANNAILTQHIDDNQVGSDQIADNAVTAAQIPDGSITATQLGANSVTLAKMASLTRGSILVGDSSADVAALAKGSANTVLKSDGTDLSYATIATANIAADAITGAKIADDAIDSEHYAAGSIDNEHIADDAIDSEHYADGSIDTAHIADDQITLAKMASGTDGNIISYDASGNPVAIATGTDGQVLTSTGAGSPPAFEAVSGGTFSGQTDTTIATSNPAITTNPAGGVGHLFVNRSTGAIFVCSDATTNENVWLANPTAGVRVEPVVPKFIRPSTSNQSGTVAADGQSWQSEAGESSGTYGGVTLDTTFTGDFTIICSWQRDYMSIGYVYADSVTSAMFDGSSTDGAGIYGTNANNDGFTTAVTIDGKYHTPSGQGDVTDDTKYYLKHERSGNTMTVMYSTNASSATDPDHASWTTNQADRTLSGSNEVKPTWMEAGDVENDPLTILYTNFDGADSHQN